MDADNHSICLFLPLETNSWPALQSNIPSAHYSGEVHFLKLFLGQWFFTTTVSQPSPQSIMDWRFWKIQAKQNQIHQKQNTPPSCYQAVLSVSSTAALALIELVEPSQTAQTGNTAECAQTHTRQRSKLPGLAPLPSHTPCVKESENLPSTPRM